MNQNNDPREWSCTDDSPLNNGWGYNAPEPDDDEIEFDRCSRCDGHDACEDFGCAFELGIGHMVNDDDF